MTGWGVGLAGGSQRKERSGLQVHFVALGTAMRWLMLGLLTGGVSHNQLVADELNESPITSEARTHWAFVPLVRPVLPEVKHGEQVRSAIDELILRRLDEQGLQLMPAADRRVLIRRVSFDLTGLPPTPEAIDQFTRDSSPDAYGQLVDRLLNSPAYGERWAQHWLDLVRFAESDGFEHDKIRPDAWRYRDWVIKALNEDLPYDEFVSWQLAGDELRPDDPEAAIATGFLLAGPDMPDINSQEERRHVVLNEMTSTVGVSLLGLGLGCAACHDHKYDPVSQADFFRMRAFFENAIHPEHDKPLGHQIKEPGPGSPATHLMIRGDFHRPGPEVQPAFLRIASLARTDVMIPTVTPSVKSSGRRTALAQWITQPDHPLALRVIANRIWQYHFGVPLAGTPNDFGFQGERPTHPDLLDWLATELPRRGWSLKSMHRLILNSATYRQASFGKGEAWDRALRVDPDNQLLSRMPRNRLAGEAIRDAMLAVSGTLNSERGGPGVRPPLPEEITITLLKDQWQVSTNVEDHHRRSVYLLARRNLRYPLFDVFDRPDANASCARRYESTTAPQSLMLLNSEFSLEMARRLAGAVMTSGRESLPEFIDQSYRLTLGRPPSGDETVWALNFVNQQAARLQKEGRLPEALAPPLPPMAGMDAYQGAARVDFCLALFNLNEFVYID